jgi:hypothetical protein
MDSPLSHGMVNLRMAQQRVRSHAATITTAGLRRRAGDGVVLYAHNGFSVGYPEVSRPERIFTNLTIRKPNVGNRQAGRESGAPPVPPFRERWSENKERLSLCS